MSAQVIISPLLCPSKGIMNCIVGVVNQVVVCNQMKRVRVSEIASILIGVGAGSADKQSLVNVMQFSDRYVRRAFILIWGVNTWSNILK